MQQTSIIKENSLLFRPNYYESEFKNTGVGYFG